MNKPTDKQLQRIDRLINYKGKKFVEDYLKRKFTEGDINSLTKEQAQKIITGLQTFEKRNPVFGVVGRDIR